MAFDCRSNFPISFSPFNINLQLIPVAYPEILFGGSTNSIEDGGLRERGSGGGSPIATGSEGSCNLVQEISFLIENFSQFLVI